MHRIWLKDYHNACRICSSFRSTVSHFHYCTHSFGASDDISTIVLIPPEHLITFPLLYSPSRSTKSHFQYCTRNSGEPDHISTIVLALPEHWSHSNYCTRSSEALDHISTTVLALPEHLITFYLLYSPSRSTDHIPTTVLALPEHWSHFHYCTRPSGVTDPTSTFIENLSLNLFFFFVVARTPSCPDFWCSPGKLVPISTCLSILVKVSLSMTSNSLNRYNEGTSLISIQWRQNVNLLK